MAGYIWNKYRNAYSGLPLEVWYLSIALFINRSGAMVLAFMTLYLTEEIEITEATAGGLLSLYGLGAISGNYVGGRLTNRVGSVRLQILMLVCAAPMFLLIPLCNTILEIGIGIFFMSFFAESVRAPNSTAIAQFTPKEKQARAYALQRMAVNLGFSFGPFVGGYLAEIDYFWIFVVDAITTLGAAGILAYFFGLQKYSKTLTDDVKQELANNIATKTRSPLADRKFLMFLGLLLATAIVFFQFHAMYPLYLRDHFGLGKPGIGKLYAINTVLIVLFEMVLIDHIKNWKIMRLIGWGCFLSCIGFGMMPFSTAVGYCVLSMVVVTVGEMLAFPLCSGWLGQRSERGDQAMYMGWYTMTFSLAGVLSPMLGGMVYQFNPHLFWYASLGVGFLVLGGFYLLEKAIDQEESVQTEELTGSARQTRSVDPGPA